MPEATSIHRYRRFTHWDYGRGASLFITIATSPRRACFGRVIGGKVKLNDLGQGGCEVGSGDGRATLGLWQQGYHDRLCLTRRFIDATERYIAYNPLKWTLMHTPGALHVHEPLDSPRLDADDYWKGVGNPDLLSPDRQIVALRVSRMVCTPAQIAAVVRRMESAVAAGYTILSGFISPGEKAVCEWLCANPKATFIRIRPSCIPNMRFKPESRFVAAFAANRFLEIGKGNDEVTFGREACLEYNEEIVKIAAAGEGLALYWRTDGVRKMYNNGLFDLFNLSIL